MAISYGMLAVIQNFVRDEKVFVPLNSESVNIRLIKTT